MSATLSLPTSTPASAAASPLPPTTTTTSTPTPAFLDRFIAAIAAAFHNTALTTAFICEIDSIPAPDPSSSTTIPSPIPHARRIQHFAKGIRESVSNPTSHATQNAILAEAGDWAAVASWEPPSYTGLPFSQTKSSPGPVLSEWRAVAARMRARYLGDAAESAAAAPGPRPEERGPARKLQPHYHLAFLARVPGREDVKGAISAVMLPFLAKARDEGIPVWLEATYPHAVAVYEHYGFRVCEEVTIGAGKVGADGWPKEDGEGVTAWGMLWDGTNA